MAASQSLAMATGCDSTASSENLSDPDDLERYAGLVERAESVPRNRSKEQLKRGKSVTFAPKHPSQSNMAASKDSSCHRASKSITQRRRQAARVAKELDMDMIVLGISKPQPTSSSSTASEWTGPTLQRSTTPMSSGWITPSPPSWSRQYRSLLLQPRPGAAPGQLPRQPQQQQQQAGMATSSRLQPAHSSGSESGRSPLAGAAAARGAARARFPQTVGPGPQLLQQLRVAAQAPAPAPAPAVPGAAPDLPPGQPAPAPAPAPAAAIAAAIASLRPSTPALEPAAPAAVVAVHPGRRAPAAAAAAAAPAPLATPPLQPTAPAPVPAAGVLQAPPAPAAAAEVRPAAPPTAAPAAAPAGSRTWAGLVRQSPRVGAAPGPAAASQPQGISPLRAVASEVAAPTSSVGGGMRLPRSLSFHHKRTNSTDTPATPGCTGSVSGSEVGVALDDEWRQQLLADRESWHTHIWQVLEGSTGQQQPDALRAEALEECHELKSVIEEWAAEVILPGEGPWWMALEGHIQRAIEGYQKGKAVTRQLREQHQMAFLTGDGTAVQQQLVVIDRQLLPALMKLVERVVGCCCQGLAVLAEDGATVGPGGTRRPGEPLLVCFHAVRHLLQLLVEMEGRFRHNPAHVPELSDQYIAAAVELVGFADQLLQGAVSAAAVLQARLLQPASLSPTASAHAISSQAQVLSQAWKGCYHLAEYVSGSLEQLQVEALQRLLQLYELAAREACSMITEATGARGSSEPASSAAEGDHQQQQQPLVSGMELLPCLDTEWDVPAAAAWGGGMRSSFDVQQQPQSLDRDVEAQQWVPGILQELLHRAVKVHTRMQQIMGKREKQKEAGLPSYPPLTEEEQDGVWDLLDACYETFYHLAVANTRRTAALATAPQQLARWARDSLTQQCEAGLQFVVTVLEHDRDKPGLGANNALVGAGMDKEQVKKMFKDIDDASRGLVRALFTLKSMSKVRAAAEGPSVAAATGSPRRAAAAGGVGLPTQPPVAVAAGQAAGAVMVQSPTLVSSRPPGTAGTSTSAAAVAAAGPPQQAQPTPQRQPQLQQQRVGTTANASAVPIKQQRSRQQRQQQQHPHQLSQQPPQQIPQASRDGLPSFASWAGDPLGSPDSNPSSSSGYLAAATTPAAAAAAAEQEGMPSLGSSPVKRSSMQFARTGGGLAAPAAAAHVATAAATSSSAAATATPQPQRPPPRAAAAAAAAATPDTPSAPARAEPEWQVSKQGRKHKQQQRQQQQQPGQQRMQHTGRQASGVQPIAVSSSSSSTSSSQRPPVSPAFPWSPLSPFSPLSPAFGTSWVQGSTQQRFSSLAPSYDEVQSARAAAAAAAAPGGAVGSGDGGGGVVGGAAAAGMYTGILHRSTAPLLRPAVYDPSMFQALPPIDVATFQQIISSSTAPSTSPAAVAGSTSAAPVTSPFAAAARAGPSQQQQQHVPNMPHPQQQLQQRKPPQQQQQQQQFQQVPTPKQQQQQQLKAPVQQAWPVSPFAAAAGGGSNSTSPLTSPGPSTGKPRPMDSPFARPAAAHTAMADASQPLHSGNGDCDGAEHAGNGDCSTTSTSPAVAGTSSTSAGQAGTASTSRGWPCPSAQPACGTVDGQQHTTATAAGVSAVSQDHSSRQQNGWHAEDPSGNPAAAHSQGGKSTGAANGLRHTQGPFSAAAREVSAVAGPEEPSPPPPATPQLALQQQQPPAAGPPAPPQQQEQQQPEQTPPPQQQQQQLPWQWSQLTATASGPPSSTATPTAAAAAAVAQLGPALSQATSNSLAAAAALLSWLWEGTDKFWHLSWDQLQPEISDELGKGSYGKVYKGKLANASVAVKMISVGDCDVLRFLVSTLPAFKKEVDLSRRLNHPNMVQFLGACCDLPPQLLDCLRQAYHQQLAAAAATARMHSSTSSSSSNNGGADSALVDAYRQQQQQQQQQQGLLQSGAAGGAAAGSNLLAHQPLPPEGSTPDPGATAAPPDQALLLAAASTISGASSSFLSWGLGGEGSSNSGSSFGLGLACLAPGIMRHVKLAIVMQLCDLGNLFKMIGHASAARWRLQHGAPQAEVVYFYRHGFHFYNSWLLRLEVLRGIAAGVQYMHSQQVVHRDLTSLNVLLESGDPWKAKVCDFNLSRALGGASRLANSGQVNSPAWASPEVLGGQDYGAQVDVFSLGVIIWEVVTLEEPWKEELEGRSGWLGVQRAVLEGARLPWPQAGSVQPEYKDLGELIQLAEACWRKAPEERPAMGEVAATLGQLISEERQRRREAARKQAARPTGPQSPLAGRP